MIDWISEAESGRWEPWYRVNPRDPVGVVLQRAFPELWSKFEVANAYERARATQWRTHTYNPNWGSWSGSAPIYNYAFSGSYAPGTVTFQSVSSI